MFSTHRTLCCFCFDEYASVAIGHVPFLVRWFFFFNLNKIYFVSATYLFLMKYSIFVNNFFVCLEICLFIILHTVSQHNNDEQI